MTWDRNVKCDRCGWSVKLKDSPGSRGTVHAGGPQGVCGGTMRLQAVQKPDLVDNNLVRRTIKAQG
jgi:hypothetical protein